MRTRNLIVILTSLCFLLPAFADDLDSQQGESGTSPETKLTDYPVPLEPLSVDVSVSGVGVDDRRESAKFQEYRDIPNGVMTFLKADYWGENYRLFGLLKNIGLDDQYYQFRGEAFGKYRIDFSYDEIPHRYAFDAQTLYSGIGTGSMEIPDSVQTFLQNSMSEADVATRLLSEFQNATSFDLENKRKKAGVSFDLFAFQPVQLKAELKHEKRSGNRPFSGSFGFFNLVELVAPTDYDTTELKFGGEYADESMFLSASYYASIFENNTTSLTFDNPFRITDSTAPEPGGIFSSFQVGPSRGRIDLFPSNDFQSVSFTTAFQKLPWNSKFSALFSWGFLRQNDELLPYTTNTSIVPGAPGNPLFPAADPATLPVDRVDTKMDTPHLQLSFNTRPVERFQLKAKYRYYKLNNESEQISFPAIVRTDVEFRPRFTPGGSFINLPIEYDQNTFDVDALFDVWNSSQISVGYTYDKTGREFREVSDLQEDRFRVAFDARPDSRFDVRATYEHSSREGNGYDFGQHTTSQGELVVSVLPFVRKFDQANRDRDRFQVQVNTNPVPPLTVSGSVIYGNDDFKDSPFGLTGDKHQVYSLESSYVVTEKIDWNAYYSYEKYDTSQRGRSWLFMGPGDPLLEPGLESLSNWQSDSEDIVNTFGAGLHASVVPDKWDAKVDFVYSKSDGQFQFASPVGLFDLNPYPPGALEEVDDVTRVSFTSEVNYWWTQDWGIGFGYWYDKYDIEDFNVNGFVNIPITPDGLYNGALLMGTLPQDYNVNVFYVTLKYRL